ncbi:alpha/beta hydrolase [Amycolatopsis rubida]|uniref:Alpha/beta hydrolase family protein n=1 Tax=Amycolatopsis rubida TaxID=112413 RepID=A0A1I5I985_9PSEU|nr:alpha/beta hydrolase family protein [Amycolatopsis rubida]SFO56601.1 Alpha/beta hydrolase family protein [Amycolatopsis rubida]
MQPTFVLVPGSHATGRCFTALQRELALRGHRSLAVDLPGHGSAGFSVAYQAQDHAAFAEEPSPMAGITHADNVAHVIDLVRRVREHGPVVLVGHSRGGFTVTSVANAVPDLLARTVYIAAWCCVTGTAADYLATPAFSAPDTGLVPVVGPERLGAVRMNWRTTDPAHLTALNRDWTADGTDAEVVAFTSALDPDESRDAGTDLVDPAAWGRVPHTYVRLTEDASMPLALQDHFIEEADALTSDNPFDVHSLPVGHIDPLLRSTGLAEILAGTADYSEGAR